MTLTLTSPAFGHDAVIPRKYTCEGADISPPLQWTDPPPGTQSYCLIVDDPDAPHGTWVHWVLYNLPAQARALPAGVPPLRELVGGGRQGQNSWHGIGYRGPCPPRGRHRYFFVLYALEKKLALAPGATKEELLNAMAGSELDQAQLMGIYGRT